MKTSEDQSLFAWDSEAARGQNNTGILADSPACFEGARRVIECPPFWKDPGISTLWLGSRKSEPYGMTQKGLKIKLPVIEPVEETTYLAVLNCCYDDDLRGPLALVLEATEEEGVFQVTHTRTKNHERERLVIAKSEVSDAAGSREITIRKTPRLDGKRPPERHSERLYFRFDQNMDKLQLKTKDHYPCECWNKDTGVLDMPCSITGSYEGAVRLVREFDSAENSDPAIIVAFQWDEDNVNVMIRAGTQNEDLKAACSQAFKLHHHPKTTKYSTASHTSQSVHIVAEMYEQVFMGDYVTVVDVSVQSLPWTLAWLRDGITSFI